MKFEPEVEIFLAVVRRRRRRRCRRCRRCLSWRLDTRIWKNFARLKSWSVEESFELVSRQKLPSEWFLFRILVALMILLPEFPLGLTGTDKVVVIFRLHLHVFLTICLSVNPCQPVACYVEDTFSLWNSKVEQCWAWKELGWKAAWELLPGAVIMGLD